MDDMSHSLVPLETVLKILGGVSAGQAKMVSYEGSITSQRNMLDTENEISVVECKVAFVRHVQGKGGGTDGG